MTLSVRPAMACLGLMGASLVACAPALDWRDLRPEGGALQMQLPCKPTPQRRDLLLAGQKLNLALHACAAGGLTWGLAVADVVDPARVGPALAELAAAAGANLGAAAAPPLALRVPGATPNPASMRQRLAGKLPDGRAVQMELAVFSHGTVVYQATVLGEQLSAEAVELYFSSLRLGG